MSKGKIKKKRKQGGQYSYEKAKKAVFIKIISFMLPLFAYIAFTCIIYPSPNSSYIVLGIFGAIILGVGLISLCGLKDNMYFGHIVTVSILSVGCLLIGASVLIMYVPSVYAKIDEQYSGFYFLVWISLFLSAVWYMLFRMAIGRKLRSDGFSKTKINELTKGGINFWWYEEVNKEQSLGLLYQLNKIFTILFALVLVLQLVVGWAKLFGAVIAVCTCAVCMLNAPMWLISASNQEQNNSEHRTTLLRKIGGFLFPIFLGAAILMFYFDVVRG